MSMSETTQPGRQGAVPQIVEASGRVFTIPEKTQLGMLVFIASESVFFLMLILGFVYLRSSATFLGSEQLDVLKTGIFSLFLFSSSATIWLADRSMQRQKHRQFCWWLAVTIGLGLIFLAGQGWEWYGLITNNVTISSSTFGTAFFTLTGFHGIHVTVGLILLAIVLVLALLGDYQGTESRAVTAISTYWHFVDVVWVVVFSVVYLWRYI